MTIERKARWRLAGAGAVGIALMAGSAYVGATLARRDGGAAPRPAAPAPRPAAPESADAIPDLVDAACPAIVAIQLAPNSASAAGNAAAPGAEDPTTPPTGFLISADGYLVTSLAGLAGESSARILLDDGRTFDGRLVGQDQLSGLALLKIDTTGLPFLAFADAHFPRAGAQGVVLASPNGSGCVAQTAMINADFLADRPGLRAFVEIRPALDPDVAGAPLLDRDRHVVAIAGLRPQSGAAPASQLLPAGTAARIVSELLRTGHAATNRFGIVADDLLPELAARTGVDRGAVIAMIKEGSPAALAGLKAGDVVLSAAGAPISGASELSRALDTNERRVSLEVSRRATRIIFNLDDSAGAQP